MTGPRSIRSARRLDRALQQGDHQVGQGSWPASPPRLLAQVRTGSTGASRRRSAWPISPSSPRPSLILLGVSFYADSEQTTAGPRQLDQVLRRRLLSKVIFDTLKLGVFAVLATTLSPIRWRWSSAPPGRALQRVLIFIILMPLLTSVVIRTFAWIVILAREGVINQTLLALGLTATPLNLLQTELGLVHRADADRDAADAAAAADHHEPDRPEPDRRLARARRLEMADLLPGRPALDAAGLDRRRHPGLRLRDDGLHLAIGDRRGAAGLPARR